MADKYLTRARQDGGSVRISTVASAQEMTPKQSEDSFEQIAIVELALERSRARARARRQTRFVNSTRTRTSIEALERAQEELSASRAPPEAGDLLRRPEGAAQLEAA